MHAHCVRTQCLLAQTVCSEQSSTCHTVPGIAVLTLARWQPSAPGATIGLLLGLHISGPCGPSFLGRTVCHPLVYLLTTPKRSVI